MPTVDLERFRGFADLYASVRPQPPRKVAAIALGILGRSRIDRVVDLGSGTGLSTSLWEHVANSVIGVEPNPEMRSQAHQVFPTIAFQDGTSYSTNVATESVDIVSCSQAFHWMEPQATLHEVNRILKPVGLFFVYDCVWPVTWDWLSEHHYQRLLQKAKLLASQRPEFAESSHQYPKDRHLSQLEQSALFAYCGRIHFDHEEECNPDRFVGIALSQGLVQSILKKDPGALSTEIDNLKQAASRANNRTMRVSYVASYGVKSPG